MAYLGVCYNLQIPECHAPGDVLRVTVNKPHKLATRRKRPERPWQMAGAHTHLKHSFWSSLFGDSQPTDAKQAIQLSRLKTNKNTSHFGRKMEHPRVKSQGEGAKSGQLPQNAVLFPWKHRGLTTPRQSSTRLLRRVCLFLVVPLFGVG